MSSQFHVSNYICKSTGKRCVYQEYIHSLSLSILKVGNVFFSWYKGLRDGKVDKSRVPLS